MNIFNNPNILDFQDCENGLHEKVNKDLIFQKYYQEFIKLIERAIIDDVLKESISETFIKVCISAEIAIYKEGYKEGIKFLINTLNNPYVLLNHQKG